MCWYCFVLVQAQWWPSWMMIRSMCCNHKVFSRIGGMGMEWTCPGGVRLWWWWNWPCVPVVRWQINLVCTFLSKNTWANRARKWWRQPMTGCIWPMYISSEQCIASVWADVRQHSFWNVLALIAHQYTLWNWKTVLKMGFFFFFHFECLDFPIVLLASVLANANLNFKA